MCSARPAHPAVILGRTYTHGMVPQPYAELDMRAPGDADATIDAPISASFPALVLKNLTRGLAREFKKGERGYREK
jgi:hypothetical protein